MTRPRFGTPPANHCYDGRTAGPIRESAVASRDGALILSAHAEQREPWSGAHLGVIDRALAADDVTVAVLAWHDAYGAALATGRWEPLVEVGDAFVRIGDAVSSISGSRANARLAYLGALTRAQRDGSVDGVRRVAQAFQALGDHAVAAQCTRIAQRLAERGGTRPG
jgi:hypothetical protein